jgi:hypothetical protein
MIIPFPRSMSTFSLKNAHTKTILLNRKKSIKRSLKIVMSLTHDELEQLAELVASKVKEIILADTVPGRWLTLKEAHLYAKAKSVNTIKKWINEGYIYAFKRSGSWIVDRESIDIWYKSEDLDW